MLPREKKQNATTNENIKIRNVVIAFGAANLLCQSAVAYAAEEELGMRELTQLGLEDLFQVEVTSVSKKPEPWFGVSAAVYTLSNEDIRRSGARTIADALRMVPGINVAQLDSSKWAVSARGFNGLYAHNLLVLIDGRSTYSPLHSGVHWDTIDTIFDDIERIEVIRGPGATMWGANAVNGVVNIITKHTATTHGGLVDVNVGDQEGIVSVRYGGAANEQTQYRLYGKYSDIQHSDVYYGGTGEGSDDWRMARTGFRVDYKKSSTDTLTLQGDYYDGALGETLSYPELSVPFSFRVTENRDMQVSGANLMGQWKRQLHDNSDFQLQFYYDRTERTEEPFEETHDTYDLDLQHTFLLSARNQIIWGGGYRYNSDHTKTSFRYGFANDTLDSEQLSVFVQDELAVSDAISATAGIKFERYDYTGWESQPNLRLAWTPSANRTLWGAVSQAVRTPSRNDDDVIINAAAFPTGGGTPAVVRIVGNSDLESEQVTAYELGYRTRPTRKSVVDVSFFYNEYERLLGTQSLPTYFENDPAPSHLVMPRQFVNDTKGRAQGVELSSTLQLDEAVRLNLWYAYLDMDVTAPDGFEISGNSPQNQAHVRLYWDLSNSFSFDTAVYYVSDLNVQNQTVPVADYVRTDIRLAWRQGKDLEIATGVRNAFDSHHPEFGSIPFIQATEMDRAFYAKLTTKF